MESTEDDLWVSVEDSLWIGRKRNQAMMGVFLHNLLHCFVRFGFPSTREKIGDFGLWRGK